MVTRKSPLGSNKQALETLNVKSNYSNKCSVFNSVIDTIGFDDPSNDTDANIISELVLRLRDTCDYVNSFIIAVNGQHPRLDSSLIGMIRIFEGMFGEGFWR